MRVRTWWWCGVRVVVWCVDVPGGVLIAQSGMKNVLPCLTRSIFSLLLKYWLSFEASLSDANPVVVFLRCGVQCVLLVVNTLKDNVFIFKGGKDL